MLPEAEAGRAIGIVEEIAAALRHAAMEPEEPLPMGRASFSLAGGWTGQALFFAYLDRARPGQGHDDTALDLLSRAFDDLGRTEAQPGLFGGLTGVAWTVEHLRGWLVDADDDPAGEIAARLAGLLTSRPWPLEFDLVSGLAGYGLYGLERLPLPLARECVERSVARLDEEGERRPEGVAWWSQGRQGGRGPGEHYNLGVAHGLPGVVGLLGRACAAGIAVDRARPLLDGAVAWLRTQENPPDAASRFPCFLVPGQPRDAGRLAWCYGDLGIAATWAMTARAAGEPTWEEAALALARAAADRSFADPGVRDAGICHGAAGNAHLFHRLWQSTGDPTFAAVARLWLDRALEMRQPGQGVGGFLAYVGDGRGEMDWRSDPGFLTGAAGIGLVLLAAATRVEPAWDRLLLAS